MSGNRKLPEHIAIIMDGNGRWAKEKGLTRNQGHQKGAEALKDITKHANEIGIKYVTVYAFSTENWRRPKDEVEGLMNLLRNYLDKYCEESKKSNLQVRVIGDLARLPEDIQEKVKYLHRTSQNNTGLGLNIAINYGGRDEIIRATKQLYTYMKEKNMEIEQIDEDLFAGFLDTCNIKDPDLMIRTSGEMRTSNFLPWQLAYSEFYFAECRWPEFTVAEFEKALDVYSMRQRRFGKSE